MSERPPTIAPPPSLEDILASTPDSRVGRVDFSSRLAPEPEEIDDVGSEAPYAQQSTSAVDADTDGAPDTDTAAAAQQPSSEPPADDYYAHEQSLYDDLVAQPETDRSPVMALPDRDRPLGADFTANRAPAAAPQPSGEGPEVDYLDLSVDRVAASVIARMREAGEASQRHLESIESEAARRCELLTAQAELDAELIRLHARREAHAIITAARMRAGAGSGADEDSVRLNEIGETFSRFAESIETTIAEAPASPDHPLRP